MISLNKLSEAIMIKLKKLENREMVQERVSFGTTWTAPHDGQISCCGRAKANTSYRFIKDITDDVYVGMFTIDSNQAYGSMLVNVIKGHTYKIIDGNWQVQDDLYQYTE